ncbi:MAG TPA: glycine--tRNA ligase [Tepidisphaeraceae bacterium]|nr:glycine--tRNA ligase [Tepidisphaeraceae bacterium]
MPDPATSTNTVMDQIVALCKRRGFVYPASEIYGGLNGFWDYGPLGTLLKNNIRDWWWRNMVECPPIGPDGHPVEMVGLDSAIIQNPKTWVASGHASTFTDPMVDDRETKQRYRADHVMVFVPRDGKGNFYAFLPDEQDLAEKKIRRDARRDPAEYEIVQLTRLPLEQYARIVAPAAKSPGTLTEPRAFNLMFITYVGAIQSEESKAYLRPETAQGIFLNFKNILDTTRVKVPFGVAQVGKSFRNEVTPRNFIFRSREFEQMEMEWFCHPDEAQQWFEFWKAERMKWWRSLGISESNLRFRDHEPAELSHYSKMTVDIEYRYPFTAPDFGELEGIAHRGCFDLTQHQQHSGQRLDYFDQDLQARLREQGLSEEQIRAASRYIPNVIEPASGLTRAVLVLLCEAYTPDESRPSRMYMRFHPRFAPIKAGIFPLVNKDGLPEIAEKLYLDLRTSFMCEYDAKQTVGKRYARMDEVGTPYCVTIDGQTKQDGTVTIRDRDTMTQQRISLDKVRAFLHEKLNGG